MKTIPYIAIRKKDGKTYINAEIYKSIDGKTIVGAFATKDGKTTFGGHLKLNPKGLTLVDSSGNIIDGDQI